MKQNRILLVTGASSDIGEALIKSVSHEYKIILVHYYHSQEVISRLKEELGDKIFPIRADFSSQESVNELILQIKDLNLFPDHIVHLSAPKIYNKKFHKDNLGNFEKSYTISFKSIVQILLAFIPHMTKQKYGKIVFMLTSNVLNQPVKYQASYVTTKYALMGLMKSISVEYADKGITANAVSPHMIETKFLSDIPELIVQQNAVNSPLGRNLTVADVVPLFKYLLSDQADVITGINIPVTGGAK